MLAYCDRFGRLIGDDVFDGARGCSVSLSYRRLLHGALANGARAMIVVHNHPSGKAIPSQEDIVSTRSLSALSSWLGMAFPDG